MPAFQHSTRKNHERCYDTICSKSIQIVTYADDLNITGKSKQAVIEAFVAIQTEAEKMVLTINEEKIKFKIGSSQQTNTHYGVE